MSGSISSSPAVRSWSKVATFGCYEEPGHTRCMRRIALITVLGLLVLPGLAGASSRPAATDVRIGDHPAFVRVVVDFNRSVPAGQVGFDQLLARRADVHVTGAGTSKGTTGGQGDGVSVALQPGTQALHITASWTHTKRFKYLSYAVVTGNRLAIDLWKSVPARGANPIHTCSGLRLSSWSADGKAVVVKGHERGVFEHQFQVVVRDANGKVLGRKVVRGPGRWTAKVPYHVASSRPGTIEAVSYSPKDGSLACLAQRGINLPAT